MDMESALVRSLEIKDSLKDSFSKISAAGDILPPAAIQKRNMDMLSKINAGKVVSDFRRIAAEKGFDAASFNLFTEGLQRMLENRKSITPGDVEPLKDVLDRVLINEDDQWRIIVTGSMNKDAGASVLHGYSYTGPAFIKEELFSILRKDTIIISMAGLLLVNITLFLDFRSAYYMLLCQVTVAFSIICTLGIMGLSGISLNFMNAIVFVLLFGIGTDYTVHLLHRYNSDRDMGATFLQTGKAVLVAGLTTIAGFGSIGFSSYKGLSTMGQVAALGVTLCMLFSLTLIPALLGLQERSSHE
jgi:predicted RND superfamily exporter protein